MRRFLVIACFATAARLAAAQSLADSHSQDAPSIKDNSFLVEEAYNQEAGVVQHINTFFRPTDGAGWMYTFTQEWPVRGQTNQFSYTIPVARIHDSSRGTTGIGDVALNYRRQVGGTEQDRLALAPRLTVLLPTGASRRGLGSGGTGFQLNIPFSAELSTRLVAHTNAGMTYTAHARDKLDNSAPTRSYALGQSLIWLALPNLNLMLEGVWVSAENVAGPGRTARSSDYLLSPGLRGAINFRSGLQIVPGLAFPFGIGSSRGERAVFGYLSFEHPFSRNSH
jgi:hypothetical protein